MTLSAIDPAEARRIVLAVCHCQRCMELVAWLPDCAIVGTARMYLRAAELDAEERHAEIAELKRIQAL